MKKAVFTQNNFMKRNFLAIFLFSVLFSCATAIIFFAADHDKKQKAERVQTAPAFVKRIKDLFPNLD
jgi:cell division protein FtsL